MPQKQGISSKIYGLPSLGGSVDATCSPRPSIGYGEHVKQERGHKLEMKKTWKKKKVPSINGHNGHQPLKWGEVPTE
jgi:hypothetical protein